MKSEMIHETISFLGLNPAGNNKSLPIMYCKRKMHKEAIGARFIVISKNCSKKLISKVVSKAFQLIFHQIQNFYNKLYFNFSFQQFWAIENSKPVLENFEIINCKTNAKAVLRFDFPTVYTNYLILI